GQRRAGARAAAAAPPRHRACVVCLLRHRPPPISTLFPTRRSSDLLKLDGAPGGSGITSTGTAPVSSVTSSTCSSGMPSIDHGSGHPKSTRLNSSHVATSYAVSCVKQKKLGGGT